MALKQENFYKALFGKQEFIIVAESENTKDVVNMLDSDYIVLQYEKSEPLWVKSNGLFSVQKIAKEAVGNQTRVWRVV